MSVLKIPQIEEDVFVAEGAILRGDVIIGAHSSVWFHAVVRAENASITIGENTNIQDNCVLHVDADADVRIGNQVTIGHGAVVHGCTIKDNTLIGMGAVILNHAVIGKNCIIGAGALITQNTVIPDNSLVIGNPGKVKRAVTEDEIVYCIIELPKVAKQKRTLLQVHFGHNCKALYHDSLERCCA